MRVGLASIGARWYDPSADTFISLDPKLETASPQQLNGYTYAGANPVGSSDPTGDIALNSNGTDYVASKVLEKEITSQQSTYYSPAHDPASGGGQSGTANASDGSTGGGDNSSSRGIYNGYDCGRFGLSCSNSSPKKAEPKSSGFNLFHWVAHTAVNIWDTRLFGTP